MKGKIISMTLVLLLFGTICMQAAAAGGDDPKTESDPVQILFTHDLHSRLDEYKTERRGSYSSNSIQGESEDALFIGGAARLKTAIDEKRTENPVTFVVDGGDFSMGTLYQTVYETEAAELTMLGRLGYDAVTLGNHEFDYRAQGIANMLNRAVENGREDKSLTLPYLVSANIDWKKNNSSDNKLIKDAMDKYGSKPYVIVEREGIRAGIYGVLGEVAESNAPESGLEFEDIVETSKEIVEQLKKEDVDIIICLSHSGTSEDTKRSEDEVLAKEVPEIDVIVSAHTHTTLEEPIVHGDTTIVSAGSYGGNLGALSVIPAENGRWKVKSYDLERMGEQIEQDRETTQQLQEYKEIINDSYLKEFGYTADQVLAENHVEFTQMAEFATELREDTLGNLIADSYVYAVAKAEGEQYRQIDMAVVPAGVVRDTFQKGQITVSDAFNVSALGIGADRKSGYPLVSVYLSGEELKTAAEVDVSISALMPEAQLYASGIKWAYNPNRLILNRATEIALVNKEVEDIPSGLYDSARAIDNDKLYRVVAGLYTAQMLGAVEDQSKGILKIIPKDEKGNVIEDFEQYIIHDGNGAEVKEWYALASYLESFDKNAAGISTVPSWYGDTQNRKVMQDTDNIVELVKNPNKIAVFIYVVLAVILVLLILLVRWIVRKWHRKSQEEADR